jgi:hypothetical protein
MRIDRKIPGERIVMGLLLAVAYLHELLAARLASHLPAARADSTPAGAPCKARTPGMVNGAMVIDAPLGGKENSNPARIRQSSSRFEGLCNDSRFEF